jgi:prophage maintenance system killer protein
LAAGLAFAVVKNHPFVDGNKRTGFPLMAAFLEINECGSKQTRKTSLISSRTSPPGPSRKLNFLLGW